MDSLTLAREALNQVQVNPAAAVTLAADAARAAHREGDLAAASVAERALGLADVHLHDARSATRRLRSAVAIARRAGAADLVAEARMTLAFALNRAGKRQQAVAEIGAALHDLSPAAHAQGLAQRAAILQQLGELDEALADYRVALPSLRRAGDLVWVQRVLLNRGLLHAFRHAYGSAQRDLHEAEELCEQLGLRLPAAFVQENLGLVHRRLGDVPRALAHLDAAASIYRELGTGHGSLLVERCEVLLSVGLRSEAREAAEAAVTQFEQAGRSLNLPEARLLLGQTLALIGEQDRALPELRRAHREFGQQQRSEWRTLARGALLLAQASAGSAGAVGFRALKEAADRVEVTGWPATALELRILAGQRGLAGRSPQEGRRELERVAGHRRRGTAVRRARAWYATALLREADGRVASSSAAAARGLQVLEEHRGTMAATDLRARASGLGMELARIGLRHALASGSAKQVLAWAERSRARDLGERPALPPTDPEQGRLLAELRAVMAEQMERRSAGRPLGDLETRQNQLERAVRDADRRRLGTATRSPGPIDRAELVDSLGDAALLEFVQVDGELHAVSVARRRTTLTSLGPTTRIAELVRWLPFALTRLASARSSRQSRDAAVAVLRRAGAELDAVLLAPLHRATGDRSLVLVPTGVLQSLPWALLPSFSGRPVTVAPSAALWLSARRRPSHGGRVVVVAGPQLPSAQQEAAEVAALYGTTPLAGPAATVAAVAAAVPGAALLHVASHGTVRADAPQFSSLQLADGPVTAYDLERLDIALETVVLAACDSGRDVVLAGDERLGLSAAFLRRSTRDVVASVVPVPDAETRPLMVALHRALRAGQPVAGALAYAQQCIDAEDTAALAAAIGFVCIGAGLDRTQEPTGSPLP